MKKRVLSLALVLALCLGLAPSAFAMTGVKVTQKGQVVDSITFKGVTVNAIYAPRATVSNYSTDSTYCCAAFVSKFYKAVYGVTVSNLTKNGGGPKASKGSFSKTTSPQVGDVVHRKTDTSTHWAIVKAVNGNTITLIEQNAWYSKADDKARVGKTYDLSDSAVTVYRYSGADNTTSTTETKTQTITLETVTITDFSLHYDANGGAGSPDSVWKSSTDSSCTHTISSQRPTRSGYTFLGWSKDANVSSPSYFPGDSITVTERTTLYAVWEKNCDGGHTWGEWQVTAEATCEENGQRRRTCSICGAIEGECILALGHSYQGKENADGSVQFVCANCGESYVEEKEPDCEDGHTWGEWTVTKEATCTKSGVQKRTCSVCGASERETLLALAHDYRVDRESSTTIYYVCANCGDSYQEAKQSAEAGTDSLENFVSVKLYYDGLFDDVYRDAWFSSNVADAYRLGLMKGTGDGVFSPGNNVTLAETVTLAARIYSIYHADGETFSGYDGGNWYDPYVNYARDKGIISENYAYTRPASREEFVRILAKALPEEALENIAGQLSFADSGEITYISDVRLLSGAGVINGINEDGQTWFKPLEPITRAEVAAIVGRMVQPDTRVKQDGAHDGQYDELSQTIEDLSALIDAL